MVIAQNYLDELCESTTPSMLMKNNDPTVNAWPHYQFQKNDAPAVNKNTLSVPYDHDREKMLRGRQQLFWNQLY